ncbi:response regulator [Candidatus Sumerlaeota bacterium]|nr:response regulator [Candidatus Sumerlaeota bacterium]
MSRFRVMVVDNDPDVRFVVTSLLALDFETVGAQNGLDALEKIERYEPDLLLMEVNMPVMNGIACCQAIQRNPYFENLPVMFLAAASDAATKKAALSVGGKAYIEKPFETSALVTRIRDFFTDAKMKPSQKEFTPEEIAQIDAAPLHTSSSAILPAIKTKGSESTAPIMDFSGIDTKKPDGKKRRIFGAAAHKEESSSDVRPPVKVPLPKPAPPPLGESKTTQLPYPLPAAKTDSKPPAPPRPAPPPPAAAPPPAPTPARMETRTPPPPAAQPPKQATPAEPTAAEILAQRRLGKFGRKPGVASTKPRFLCIIDYPELLGHCANAARGLAEFLPLEDPVEAVELVARFQPDIVLLGIQSSKYSGLQIAQMIASNPRLAHIELIFLQEATVTPQALTAARKLTRNPILRTPSDEATIHGVLREVLSHPGFKVREKNLPYGVYVKEVIKQSEDERARENKTREKKSLEMHHRSLAAFMAAELKDYKEPAGMDELYGIGRNVHVVKE